jgi:hypothetical protein
MAYKLELRPIPTATCYFCQTAFRPVTTQAYTDRPCCGAGACSEAKAKKLYADWRETASPEEIAAKNQANCARYWADPVAGRERSRVNMANARVAKPEQYRAAKRTWRAEKKGTPEYEAALKAERAAYYQRLREDPERLSARAALNLAWKRAHGQRPRTKMSAEEAAEHRAAALARYRTKQGLGPVRVPMTAEQRAEKNRERARLNLARIAADPVRAAAHKAKQQRYYEKNRELIRARSAARHAASALLTSSTSAI